MLRSLVEGDAYVGEVVSLGYNDAILQIHDFHRQQVGGIPALCFLLASRVNPQTTPDARAEDASVILLRVMDHADLPNAEEAKRVRVETAQRVSGEVGVNWDDRAVMDATTHQLLSYAGVRCRVIGTFYMTDSGTDSAPDWQLCFGSDISNYYPNRGLKVYKPRDAALAAIANYRDPQRLVFDPSHPLYALRPREPLTVTFGFYSPAVSFCYPGGEGTLGSPHGS